MFSFNNLSIEEENKNTGIDMKHDSGGKNEINYFQFPPNDWIFN